MANINYMRLARTGYQAYLDCFHHHDEDGNTMRAWHQLSPKEQQGWEAATVAVTSQYYKLLETDDASIEAEK